MRIQLPQSNPDRIKLALSCLIVHVAIMLISEIPSLIWYQLPNNFLKNHQTTSILLSAFSVFTSPVAYCLLIFALSLTVKANVFKAKRQCIAVIAIQCITSLQFLYAMYQSISYIDILYMQFSGAWPGFLPDWFNNINFSSLYFFPMRYALLATSIAWLIILAPPSFNLINWSPRREKICRSIFITYFAFYIWWYVQRLIYWINPFDFKNVTYSRLETFFSHIQFVTTWSYPILLLAALIFLIHLRRNAHQLIFDPNHCSNCAYPLDQSMTTCPECGVIRAQPPEPTAPSPFPGRGPG